MAKKFSPARKIPDSPLNKGISNLMYHNKIFSEMYNRAYLELRMVESNILGKDSAAIVQSNGQILLNKDFKLNASEWEYIIAHCVLHLAFGHFDAKKIPSPCNKKIWNMACDIYIAKFLSDVKIGTAPFDSVEIFNAPKNDEVQIYNFLLAQGKNLGDYNFYSGGKISRRYEKRRQRKLLQYQIK